MVSGLPYATFALFRLAFAAAPHFLLNLATYRNSPVHSSIGTPSSHYCSSTGCRHTVSGSLSLPSRGAFHLSLTVLCAIGRYQCFALEGGPPCFPRGFSCPAVLRISGPATPLSPTGLSPSSAVRSSTLRLDSWHCCQVLYPVKVSFIGLGVCPVRSPLLGVSRLISFPPAT